jgi:hypothetical protein
VREPVLPELALLVQVLLVQQVQVQQVQVQQQAPPEQQALVQPERLLLRKQPIQAQL